MRKARSAAIRSRVKWQKVGDKCLAKFFKSVRQKNTQSVISELRDNQGRCFTNHGELEKICLDFYKNLYQYKKKISKLALGEVLEDLLVTFTTSMNETLSRELTEKEL